LFNINKMKNLISWRLLWPHLLAVIGFAILSVAYVSPVLQGKKLNMHDDKQAKAAAKEVVTYHEKTGEWSGWTNSMFSGMPAFMIAGDYPTSLSTKIGQGVNKILPAPANYLLIALVSSYLLFLVLGAGGGLAALGAIGFAFASFNLISLEAGHVSKVIAIAYAPGVLAGILLAFRKNWLVGSATTAFFLSLELYANHVQITYYLGISIIALVAVEGYVLIKKGETKKLILVLAGLGLSAAIAVSNHTTRLWNAYDYTKETIRGKSDLTPPPGSPAEKNPDGVGKEYAFHYSYGVAETLTLLIPNVHGGSSVGSLTPSSETYKVLINRGVDPAQAQGFVKQLPLYWGDQPQTGGPAYAGAIIFFLFVLALFIVKSPLKWWAAGLVLLYVIWACGKNLAGINYLFFDYFPMYSKFRAVTMTLALAQLLMVLLSVLALKKIVNREISWAELQRPFLISLGITAGICLILAVAPGIFFSFQSASDARFAEGVGDIAFGQQIVNAIVSDRAGMLKGDAFRSFIFIILSAGLIWLWMKEKIKPVVLFSGLIILMVFDTFGVDKRYLNDEDFVSAYALDHNNAMSPADEKILSDPDPDFKVLDLSAQQGPFNSAEASYFHKSVGGYHGAKLRRYQELFERQIAKQGANPGILAMLNTKYFISVDEKGNKVVIPQSEAYGHAWFVNSYRIVPNADAEMKALDTLKPRTEAVIDQRFADQLKGLTIQSDSTDKISLITYKPNELTYESSSKAEGLAVFSEIYYNVRDEWKVTIDGKPADILRANYVLRALRVPAGKHTIVFKFEPVSVVAGGKVDLVSSLLLIALIVGAVVVSAKNKAA
jgi:hypothetical protein